MIDFIIMGTQKGGTVAAGHNLCAHPDVWINPHELHYFDSGYLNWDLDWYFGRVGVGKASVVGERTPNYIARLDAQRRIRASLPNVKMIVLLRNPIYRAFSQWRMETRKQIHDLPFLKRWRRKVAPVLSMAERGHYADQLKNLFNLFPREQVHIAISEYVLKDMDGEYRKMLSFLGVKQHHLPCEKRHTEYYRRRIAFDDWKLLYDYYKPLNEDLFDLLGYRIPEWSNCDHLIGM